MLLARVNKLCCYFGATDDGYYLEIDLVAAVRGLDRHAGECARRLSRGIMGRPLAATGVLVCRLSHALLSRPLSLRLGGRIHATRSLHARRDGAQRSDARTCVRERRTAKLSGAWPQQMP